MTTLYKGIDLRMLGHPVKKDIFFTFDATSISNSLKMLVNTNFYERPFNSEYGSNIRALLFELSDQDTTSVAKDRLLNTINKWEPRVSVQDVVASLDEHTMNVSIYYRILNKTEVNRVDITLRLNR